MYVLGLSGWNSKGEYITDSVAELEAKGIKAEHFKYGFSFFTVKSKSKAAANGLVSAIKAMRDVGVDKIMVFGHSNGCRVIHRAALMGAEIDLAVYFSPALNRKAERPKGIGQLHVYHTRKDWAVRWGRLVPFSLWGDMGAVGYQGKPDEHTVNHDVTNAVSGHSKWPKGYFARKVVLLRARKIALLRKQHD